MTAAAFLVAHGSALILPLAVVEGPVVSIIVGILSAQGYFTWYWAFWLLVCGDLIGDLIYYAIGRAGFTRLPGRLRMTLGVRNDLVRNSTRMLLVGKWTHALGCVVLIGCGMLRMPPLRFLLVNLLATLPKSAALLGLGYFAGDRYPFFEDHVVFLTFCLCLAGAGAIGLMLRRSGR